MGEFRHDMFADSPFFNACVWALYRDREGRPRRGCPNRGAPSSQGRPFDSTTFLVDSPMLRKWHLKENGKHLARAITSWTVIEDDTFWYELLD